jgi:hypothetical protein
VKVGVPFSDALTVRGLPVPLGAEEPLPDPPTRAEPHRPHSVHDMARPRPPARGAVQGPAGVERDWSQGAAVTACV